MSFICRHWRPNYHCSLGPFLYFQWVILLGISVYICHSISHSVILSHSLPADFLSLLIIWLSLKASGSFWLFFHFAPNIKPGIKLYWHVLLTCPSLSIPKLTMLLYVSNTSNLSGGLFNFLAFSSILLKHSKNLIFFDHEFSPIMIYWGKWVKSYVLVSLKLFGDNLS